MLCCKTLNVSFQNVHWNIIKHNHIWQSFTRHKTHNISHKSKTDFCMQYCYVVFSFASFDPMPQVFMWYLRRRILQTTFLSEPASDIRNFIWRESEFGAGWILCLLVSSWSVIVLLRSLLLVWFYLFQCLL